MELMKEEVLRRYAKYVFMDVVRFSNRSAEAQSEIVQHLNEIVRQALNVKQVNYDEDCILIPTGDGLCMALISAAMAYDAHLRIGLSILQLIQKHNDDTENETRRFQVRIGIDQNTDIVVSDINGRKNIAGAGINMASRIMDKADGGQVLVSEAVFHELQPSEVYMNQFKHFFAVGKHNIRFQLHQYVGANHIGLNRETPSAFAVKQPTEQSLSLKLAYYFAHATKHKQNLLRIKATTQFYRPDAAVILLYFLATDSSNMSETSEFDEPPFRFAFGKGERSLEEQYEHYKTLDGWVRDLAEANIRHSSEDNDGLKLEDFSQYFEESNYITHYEFVNDDGIEKLRTEWPEVWAEFQLDDYL